MTAPMSAVSFDAFYRAEHPRVLGYFRRKVGREAATDLAQEVFARLLRSGAFEHADCPQAYLTRIARNLLIDITRRKKSSPTAFYQFDEARDAASCADQSWRIEAADLSVQVFGSFGVGHGAQARRRSGPRPACALRRSGCCRCGRRWACP